MTVPGFPVNVTLFYPDLDGSHFDHAYCRERHLPLLRELLSSAGLVGVQLHRGIVGSSPGAPPPYHCMVQLAFGSLDAFKQAFALHLEAIMDDLPNFASAEPQVQVSELIE